MVTLSGKAMYVGYLKGCTVYADLDGDLQQGEGEPTSTTDAYGGWSLEVEEAAQAQAEVLVLASPDCVDRSTELPLSMPLRSPAGCTMVSMLSDLKYSLSKSYVAGGMAEVEAIAAADGALANALGLSEAARFDACTFDPLAQLWAAQLGAARRLLGAGHRLELGAARRLEQATALLSAYLALNLQLVTLVSGVASVTGFEGDAAYASSAGAVLASVVDQLVAHSAKVDSGAAPAGDLIEIDAVALVSAAEAAAGVTLGPALRAALADSAAATADYVASAAAESVGSASSSADALTTIATVGVLGQTDDPAVETLLEDARAGGSSDLSSFTAAASLSESLIAASTPEALEVQAAAITVPVPVQAPSPLPPPSPPSPGSDALGEQQETNQEAVELQEDLGWTTWLLLLLLLPVLCLGCLCFRYPGNVALWFRYRFSHSSPKLLVLYLPEETRESMRKTLASSRRDQNALPLRRLFVMSGAKVRVRTPSDDHEDDVACCGKVSTSTHVDKARGGSPRPPVASGEYGDVDAHMPTESEDLEAPTVDPNAPGVLPPPIYRAEVKEGVDARCAESSGATLLIAAAFGGQEAIVRMLLQRGASVNLPDDTGSTALMGAAAMGHLAIVQALLEAKADATLQTKGNRTALMGAEHHGHAEIAQLLRQHLESAPAASDDARPAAAGSSYDVRLPEPVRLAAEEGDAQAVAAWLDRNWGVNRKGCSPPAIQVSFTTQPQRPSSRLLRI